jgi:Protein of unknown function (DUF3224)
MVFLADGGASVIHRASVRESSDTGAGRQTASAASNRRSIGRSATLPSSLAASAPLPASTRTNTAAPYRTCNHVAAGVRPRGVSVGPFHRQKETNVLGIRHSRRNLLAVLTAAVTVAVAASPALGAADGGHGTKPIEFTSTQQLVGGDAGCDPSNPTRCAGTFRSVRTLSGDLSGTAYAVGSAVQLADGTYQGTAVVQFTGSVAGCGDGTLVMVENGVLDPFTGNSWGTWSITPGQGAGDLAGTAGQGSLDTRISPVIEGTIRCA